ncbi:MAG: hypothetical protein AB1489_37765 [Acidobacteriota bacterium]
MRFCYLCHDQLTQTSEGTISYTASAISSDMLYACGRCVTNLGADRAFDLLEEHYEHRASMRETLHLPADLLSDD